MTGFIGGGNMAEALIKGMVKSQPPSAARPGGTSETEYEIFVSEPSEERRKYLQRTYDIRTTQSNKEVVSASDILILAVKPQILDSVLDEIAGLITDEKTVVSIAAGITLSYLSARINTKKLIRVMPNTPALVQEGMSVMSLYEGFPDKDIAAVKETFMSIGKVLTMPEESMNAVTALSGSGPAFFALFVEAMIESGEQMGLRREDAAQLAVQTMCGTAKLLDTGMSPEKLRQMVTSPGGTTEAGLGVFGEKDLKGTVGEALSAARKRAEELGRRA